MQRQYNVAYDDQGETHIYCVEWSDHATMERMLLLFISRYLNADGTGKMFPNGKGRFSMTNPRIVYR